MWHAAAVAVLRGDVASGLDAERRVRFLNFEVGNVVSVKIVEPLEPGRGKHAEHEELGLLPRAFFGSQAQFVGIAFNWSWVKVSGRMRDPKLHMPPAARCDVASDRCNRLEADS